MSWKVLLVVIALGIVAVPRDGHAEKAKTNQAAKLYSRAGEQAPVILKMKEGQTVQVLAKDGRWIKVRVSGRTGWVPRSKIDLPQEEDVARNTRRRPFVDGRGTKRGFGGEAGPEDRVGADATGEGDAGEGDKPAKASKEDEDTAEEEEEPARPAAKKPAKAEPRKPEKPQKAEAKPAAKASEEEEEETVVVDDEEPAAEKPEKKPAKPEKKAEKASSEDEDEKPAKAEPKKPARPTAHVAKATPAYAKPSADSDEQFTAQPKVALLIGDEKGKYTHVETEDGESGYVLTTKLERDSGDEEDDPGARTRHIDLRGRLGLSRIGRSVSQAGGSNMPPDNYSTAGASITLALGGSVLYPYKARLWIGGEGNYDLDKNLGGVTFMGQTTGLTYHNLNLRAMIGYDLQNAKAMVVFGRLGLHYESFQVADVADLTKNTATIPSQNVVGPTIGVGLAIPKLSQKLALRLSLDAMVAGASVTQTKNLEDGTGPSAKAVYVGGQLNYHLMPKIDLQGTVDVGYTSLSFSGPPPASSQRMHTGTGNVSSSDLATTLTFGVAYEL